MLRWGMMLLQYLESAGKDIMIGLTCKVMILSDFFVFIPKEFSDWNHPTGKHPLMNYYEAWKISQTDIILQLNE